MKGTINEKLNAYRKQANGENEEIFTARASDLCFEGCIRTPLGNCGCCTCAANAVDFCILDSICSCCGADV